MPCSYEWGGVSSKLVSSVILRPLYKRSSHRKWLGRFAFMPSAGCVRNLGCWLTCHFGGKYP